MRFQRYWIESSRELKPSRPRGDGAKETAEQIRDEGWVNGTKQARKDAEEGFQELLAWVRVALVEGVGKVQGPKVQAVVARSLPGPTLLRMEFERGSRTEISF